MAALAHLIASGDRLGRSRGSGHPENHKEYRHHLHHWGGILKTKADVRNHLTTALSDIK
jgi:hypothetical protein